MSNSLQPIPIVRRYYEARQIHGDPIIVAHFSPEKGWRYTSYKKRVSRPWCRKLRNNDGVTVVQLGLGGVYADFSIQELLSEKRIS